MSLERVSPIGRGAYAECDLRAPDYIGIQAADSESLGKVVVVAVTEYSGEGDDAEETTTSVVVTAPHARAIAAAILNAADATDGTVPLVFHPESPEAVEPGE